MNNRGHCSICKFYSVKLFADHSHATGCIRGYVCNRCNAVLGMIERGTHHHENYHFVVKRDTGIQRWSKGFNKKKDRKCAHGLPYDDDSIICPACEIEVSEE